MAEAKTINKEDARRLAAKFVARHKATDELWRNLQKLAGVDMGGPLGDNMWLMAEAGIEAVEMLIGDEWHWLTWFIYGNDYGKNKMEIVVNGKKRKIRTLTNLINAVFEEK